MPVDEAGHEHHARGVDHLAGACPRLRFLPRRQSDRRDRVALDEHTARAQGIAHAESDQPRVGDVEARRHGAQAVSDGYQWRLPACAIRPSHSARIRTARFAARTACSMPP